MIVHPTIDEVFRFGRRGIGGRRGGVRFPGGRGATPSPPPPTWAPSSIPGLTGWWRGDDVTLSGSNVSSWNDKSGNGRHFTQATGANQPLFVASDANFGGQPTLDFNGSTHRLGSTWTLANIFDAGAKSAGVVFIADTITGTGSSNPTGNNGILMNATAAYTTCFSLNATQGLVASNYDGNYDMIAVAQPTATLTQALFRHAGGFIYVNRNGGTFTSVASGNTSVTTNTMNVGCNQGATVFFDGQIAELWTSNQDISGADQADWAAYCTARYGV
jgi:hypothetical protein